VRAIMFFFSFVPAIAHLALSSSLMRGSTAA